MPAVWILPLHDVGRAAAFREALLYVGPLEALGYTVILKPLADTA
jgi:hypothetical protein